MELIITLIVLIIIWCIAFMVGNKQGANRIVNQIKKDGGYYDMEYTSSVYPILEPTSSVNNDTMEFNPPHFKDIPKWSSLNNDTMGSIGSKPKTQTDYQNEHKVEDETPAIDFMHNWIQEKSGKKDSVSQKRKPKTTKEWEDEFDIGGNS
jgi:hypothetical protein